jgi:hypothetical protein
MEALEWLLSFDVRIIVPGHGPLCGMEEVARQLNYLQTSWERTREHLAQGHSLEEAMADPGYPKYSNRGYEQLHTWNIKAMYRQLKKLSG